MDIAVELRIGCKTGHALLSGPGLTQQPTFNQSARYFATTELSRRSVVADAATFGLATEFPMPMTNFSFPLLRSVRVGGHQIRDTSEVAGTLSTPG